MSVVREAIVLPLLFLTVTLLGGLRLGAPVRFIPPPLLAIVVGTLTVAALIRAAALEPRDFVAAHRQPLEKASGAIVLIALGAASIQVFTLLTPDRGLLPAAAPSPAPSMPCRPFYDDPASDTTGINPVHCPRFPSSSASSGSA